MRKGTIEHKGYHIGVMVVSGMRKFEENGDHKG